MSFMATNIRENRMPNEPEEAGPTLADLPPRVRRSMALRGWTHRQLAERAGVSTAQIWRLLNGRNVHPSTTERICRALLDNQPETAVAEFLAAGEGEVA